MIVMLAQWTWTEKLVGIIAGIILAQVLAYGVFNTPVQKKAAKYRKTVDEKISTAYADLKLTENEVDNLLNGNIIRSADDAQALVLAINRKKKEQLIVSKDMTLSAGKPNMLKSKVPATDLVPLYSEVYKNGFITAGDWEERDNKKLVREAGWELAGGIGSILSLFALSS